jgi:16S rRNA (guanine527-N7)-methyltransferase
MPLEALLESGGVRDAALRGRLAAYGRMVLEANRSFNLTGAKTEAELAGHLLDSLTLVPYVAGDIVDVGSGGGFPAIPLGLATERRITMIESTLKKAKFLQSVLDELEIAGQVVPQRAEDAARSELLRDRFSTGTARAVASGPTVIELVLPFLAPGGKALLQRGKLDERESAAMSDAAPMLGGVLEEDVSLEGDRRIVIVRKRSETPQRFPRRPGVPAQRPLCLD